MTSAPTVLFIEANDMIRDFEEQQISYEPDIGSLDITGAKDVEIIIRRDGKVLWVNTAVMRLRICRIDGSITFRDARRSRWWQFWRC